MPPRTTALAAGALAAALVAVAPAPPTPAQEGALPAEVARRAAHWQTNPAFRPFTANVPDAGPAPFASGTTATTSALSTGPRTKMALCFGVNSVDPAAYGSAMPLRGPENDARNLHAAARQLGFASELFLTRQVTSATVLGKLREAAARLGDRDILLVTYAGHGSTVPDRNGDEKRGEDQTWCLYDRNLIDDELAAEWAKFRQGVRIYVVADSCHSGTSARALAKAQNPLGQLQSAGARALANAGEAGDVLVRTLLQADQQRAVALQEPRFGGTWANAPRATDSIRQTRASVLLLAGCQDDETAGESGGHGFFTTALLRAIDGGRFTGSYRELLAKADEYLTDPNQHPNLDQFGALTESLENDRPFQ